MLQVISLITACELEGYLANGFAGYLNGDITVSTTFIANGRSYYAANDLLDQDGCAMLPEDQVYLITLEAATEACRTSENVVVSMMASEKHPLYIRNGRLFVAPSALVALAQMVSAGNGL